MDLRDFINFDNIIHLEITDSLYNGKYYAGSESKDGVTLSGVDYLLKRRKRDWNNVLCEHITSSVINALGGDSHKTALIYSNNEIVVLCRDFTNERGQLESMSAISTSSFDADTNAYDYFFDDICYELSKLHGVRNDVVNKFIEMYVFATIFGNTDRHSSNWGLCNLNGVRSFAPIFDNGACLFPRADFKDLNPEWLRERIVTWPNSKIMFGVRRRASYFELWRSNRLPDYAHDYGRSLDISKAINWIYSQRYLTESTKKFYEAIITNRYHVLIKGEDYAWNESYC